MQRRKGNALLYLLGLFVLAGSLALGGSEPPARERPQREARGGSDRETPNLLGTWVGTWTDTIFDFSGEVSMEVHSTRDGVFAATGEIDLSSLSVFGDVGVEDGSAEGDVVDGVIDFSFSAANVGNGAGTCEGNEGWGTGTVIAPLSFGNFTYEGFVSEMMITGIFDFNAGGAGRVTLYNVTPAAERSWSEVKAEFRSE